MDTSAATESVICFLSTVNVDTHMGSTVLVILTFEIGFSFGGPLCLGIEPFTS